MCPWSRHALPPARAHTHALRLRCLSRPSACCHVPLCGRPCALCIVCIIQPGWRFQKNKSLWLIFTLFLGFRCVSLCIVFAKNAHFVLPHMQPGATGDVEVKSRTCGISLLFSDFILNWETYHSRLQSLAVYSLTNPKNTPTKYWVLKKIWPIVTLKP